MKQAIAGVAPAELDEVTQMEVWPSISATRPGRLLGRAYGMRWPDVYIFRLGNLLALLTIPAALLLYFYRLTPSLFGTPLHGVWYRLTNRRVIVLRNEVHWGRASRRGALVAGLMALAFWVLISALVFFGIYGAEWPETVAGWIPLAICLLGLASGCIPLVADVPCPHFFFAVEMRSVVLDRYDEIEVEVQPGQAWFAAGDLIFRNGGTETFRLIGVPRPQAFRHVLIKAHMSYAGVNKALAQQTVAV